MALVLPLRIWLRLLTCMNMTEGMIRARLHAQFATTLPRFDVLAALDAAGAELTMGALSARLMVTSGNVTGLINAMEQDGLVVAAPASGGSAQHADRHDGRGSRSCSRAWRRHTHNGSSKRWRGWIARRRRSFGRCSGASRRRCVWRDRYGSRACRLG